MSRRVAEMIDAGGRAESEKTFALQYLFLTDLVSETFPAGDVTAARLESLSFLDTIPAQKLVDAATPFLRQNVRRLALSAAEPLEARTLACDGFMATVFDSFFDLLPDQASVTLLGNEAVPLPALKLMLPAQTGPVTLRRTGSTTFEWSWEGGSELVTIGGNRHAIPGLTVHDYPEALLVTTASPLLLSKSHIDKLTVRPELMQPLADMIRSSLGIITAADPARAARLTSLIRYYFPIATPDARTTHNSFSAADLVGVIFLSDAYNDLRLVEAIVHEYHHNELHVLLEARELFDSPPGQLYYSPWRDDPRPLYGLFHAVHVFSSVIDFFVHGLAVDELKEHHDVFRERSEHILWQVRTGIKQIRADALTADGASIIDSIEAELHDYEVALGAVDPRFPEQQRVHAQKWQARNPGLRVLIAE